MCKRAFGTIFLFGGVKYSINDSTVSVTGYDASTLPENLEIPNTVTNGSVTYTVTSIGDNAFYACTKLSSVYIPNTVTSIGNNAFNYCYNKLNSVTFEENSNLTTIGSYAFYYCSKLSSIIIPKNVVEIKSYAFYYCTSLTSVTFLSETAPSLTGVYNAFLSTPNTKTLTVPFGSDYSAWESYTTWGRVIYKTNVGETKTLNYTFLMTTANKREVSNEGVIKIEQGGEIVNATENNVGGIIEVVTPQKSAENWNFCGAPFGDYKLEVVKPVENSDVAVCTYNYGNGAWNNHWATIDTAMKAGESAFAYHFYTGPITFTTYGDLGTQTNYPTSATAKYYLNNSDVTVSNSIVLSENGYWMPLANPYPAKLSVSKFLQNPNNVQGQGVYVWNGTSFDLKPDGDIKVTEGFFVNYSSAGSHTATFKKSQLTNYPPSTKSEVASREFIELALEKGEESVKVYFARNEDAEQEYDIYDANKMFATMGATEPYFLTDGIALIKEEVKTLPYYATMNVRSEDDTVMNFVMKNLPDRYAVSIIDGDNVIDMTEGSVYSTEIARGDNEGRFKLLVKQGVGLVKTKDFDVKITNSNRYVTVQSAENNLNIEVYNALGQKVFATKEHNFILKGVSAGAYMVKAYNNKSSETAKIVIQ
ncbi:MAG: leucine-rich repeat domain-containing protein [Bacteroidales bacterium]|nr:leucine-rich repeat domain-containing protein [Bacteroidales bacterium]